MGRGAAPRVGSLLRGRGDFAAHGLQAERAAGRTLGKRGGCGGVAADGRWLGFFSWEPEDFCFFFFYFRWVVVRHPEHSEMMSKVEDSYENWKVLVRRLVLLCFHAWAWRILRFLTPPRCMPSGRLELKNAGDCNHLQ